MFVKILASISAEVIQVDQIRMMPRWMLGGRIVLIGSYYSAEEHDHHVTRTVGSTDWLWSGSDELRFDPKTLLLESAQLRVPDSHLGSSLSLVPWQAAQRVDGIICLTESQNFHLSPADFRWMDPQGETLVCFSQGSCDTAQSRLRLRIAQNLELFLPMKGCVDGHCSIRHTIWLTHGKNLLPRKKGRANWRLSCMITLLW